MYSDAVSGQPDARDLGHLEKCGIAHPGTVALGQSGLIKTATDHQFIRAVRVYRHDWHLPLLSQT